MSNKSFEVEMLRCIDVELNEDASDNQILHAANLKFANEVISGELAMMESPFRFKIIKEND